MIAVMSAMKEELGALLEELGEEGRKVEVLGGREYHSGLLFGKEVVLAFSGWGKVASASVATTLLQRFGAEEIIFTGVAGALDPDLQVGDVVLASDLIQHDMDASPVPGIQRFEIPLLGKTRFQTDPTRRARGFRGISRFLEGTGSGNRVGARFPGSGDRPPRVVQGLVASGDQFVADPARKEELLRLLPDLLCVEMEGAAVAQVCFEHQRPVTVIRTISDTADDTSPEDFPAFLRTMAGEYSRGIVEVLLSGETEEG